MEYISNCVDDTEALGEALARVLAPGSVVAFSGRSWGGQDRVYPGACPGAGD